ncbi:MAG TPA: OB-fold nucleic acid binding domain-containing protein, partial [Candidatus Limnocylindrales bacterium]
STPVDAAADTDLVDLAAHIGQPVKVAGLIAALTPDGFVLDDGTATATIVLSGDALDLEALLHEGDALAASGVVTSDGDELRVRVSAATDLVRVGDLGQAMPVAGSPDPGAAASAGTGADATDATLATASGFDGVGPLGLGAMLTLSGLSVVVTLVRRQQERRRLRAVILARLAAFHTSSPGPESERDRA